MTQHLRLALLISAALATVACSEKAPMRDAARTKAAPQAQVVQQRAEDTYQQGKQALAETRYATSAAHFRDALIANPDHMDARNGLAVALSAMGEYTSAARLFDQILEVTPGDPFVLSNLGYLRLMEGRPTEAIDLFERSLVIDADNARTLANLAAAQFLERQMEASARGEREPASAAAAPSTVAVSSGSTTSSGVTTMSRSAPEIGLVSVAPNIYELRRAPEPTVRSQNSRPVDAAVVVPVSPGILHLTSTAPANTRARWAGTPDTAAARGHLLRAMHQSGQHGGAADAVARATHAVPAPSAGTAAAARLEVANGNGVTGMARRVSRYLQDQGHGSAHLTNVPGFSQAVTSVQYRPGFEHEAQRLQMTLPVASELVTTTRLRPNIDVRVVIGRDIAGQNVATWTPPERIAPEAVPAVTVALQ